ncbi:MAG: energy-coupling factor transporter ATPase [Lachnospiraceae bacterium]|nr:energy-coupling factor transporter ATPase [Lachnospiraceae bacterium]
MLKLEHVNYEYGQGTEMVVHALKDINLEIQDGEFIGLIGHTGSGKSTLVQHLNGLIRATSGVIYFDGENIYADGFSMKELRQKVGLVFQYPEHQLFEVDVLSDVCFGPKNMGLSVEEAQKEAKEALTLVGLGEEYYKWSPFELSGGQKRRAAIAGVLAMKPRVLILDEPTAGLDPQGREEILNLVASLREKTGMTVVLISHSMEDVAQYVSRIVVMNHGQIAYDGEPREVFSHYRELEQMGLAAPQVTYALYGLKNMGLNVDTDMITVEAAADNIAAALREYGASPGETGSGNDSIMPEKNGCSDDGMTSEKKERNDNHIMPAKNIQGADSTAEKENGQKDGGTVSGKGGL